MSKLVLDCIDFPNLYALSTIGQDNSCFAHAILRACNKSYMTKSFNEKLRIARDFRNFAADRLNEIDPITGETYYRGLFNGKAEGLSLTIPDYSLKQMESDLRGTDFLDHHLQELISNAFNKDIYFISVRRDDSSKGDVLVECKEVYKCCYKGRNSIVILHHGDHYETVGVKDSQGNYATIFLPEHPLIIYLNRRMITKLQSM